MRLAPFIRENMEAILKQWETFADHIQPLEGDMNRLQLRDHAEAMLKVVAADLDTPQTDRECVEKSLGNEPKAVAPTAAQKHADERLRAGFSIHLMVSEYRALRASVLRLWLQKNQKKTDIDVSDMMRFNEAIDQALGESVETYEQLVAESQDTFVGILGHDLRAPLQSISLGSAYLMRSPDADGRMIQLGARMYNSAIRMGAMLDDLLDYTRLRIGGGLGISMQPTDLAPVAAQVVEEFLVSHPGRIIRKVTSGDCSGNWDGRRIGQVLQNLIGNALQYSVPASAIDVVIQGSEKEAVFTVRNEGTPIPESAQKSLFDPLRRHVGHKPEENFTSTNLGLGLYIAQQVVIAHHGNIAVASTAAEGTIFTVTLPKSSDKKPGKLL